MKAHNLTTVFAKDHFYQTVGAAIRKTRDDRGMSQADMARASGLNQSTVQNAESGQTCSLLVLARLADALDCSLDALVPTEALA